MEQLDCPGLPLELWIHVSQFVPPDNGHAPMRRSCRMLRTAVDDWRSKRRQCVQCRRCWFPVPKRTREQEQDYFEYFCSGQCLFVYEVQERAGGKRPAATLAVLPLRAAAETPSG